MRCSSIKKNKCWNRIESELTSNSIRLLIDFLHIDVVNLPFLKRVGLVGSFSFLFWEFISIMPRLLALETLNLTNVLLDRLTSTATSTVVALISTHVVLVLVIVMTTMMLVVMMAVVVLVEFPMLVGS